MSGTPGFTHLHLHSEYSLLDGGNRIDDLIERVKSLDMSAVAVTDHGNLFGAIEFYRKARAEGIKPILGIEAYVAPGDRRDKSPTGIADGGFHLVLLAENNSGWRHLLKLSSDSFANGFYYKPRMDRSTLAEYSDGLIAINGHLGSSIAHHLLHYVETGQDEHYDAAREEARWHAETFGTNERGEPRFYIELQRIDVPEQERINPHLLRLARELDLPVVCDNDAHFLTADHHDVHDTLCCISMQKMKEDRDRLIYAKTLYIKSPQEMAERFDDLTEAVENTVRIAERCNVQLDFDESHAPVVQIVCDSEECDPETLACAHPTGSTEWYNAFCRQFELAPVDREQERESSADLKTRCDEALAALAHAGAIWRYGHDGITPAIRARLDRELTILADKNISAYFLIVWDFVNWARQRGIPANARGSGVGTMVGYVLGLSNACPVKYGLLFERFTDPDRSEYPDIDIDICQDGRGEVINYVREKYGHVAQIITFGRLKAKAAVKDVARVMGFSALDGQRLSNLIPNELNITIDRAIDREPELAKAIRSDPRIAQVIEHARGLENHARHAGIHAAGVVVATQPLDNIVPLCKATGSDDIITQWDGPTCEKVGLLKMDFLGLRTLSTIERAKRLIRETLSDDVIRAAIGADAASDPLDLERLKYDDQKVFELFRRGDTSGVFQFESSGMRQLLVEMQPDRLEDLIAANALYRPGPMELIPQYNMRKHGTQPVPKVHDIVDALTQETYGVMVYQEQVMQIVHELGDIPLREAYTLIKAISKKNHAVIDAARPKFIDGAGEKGLSPSRANELFDLILKFAGYGFNKSHSTGYAIIAYQTAYLKTYFPNHYMAALLTFESQARKIESWAPYLEDCRTTVFPDHTAEHQHVGVKVLPPDINKSAADFTVVFDDNEPRDHLHGHIRFGLGAVKGAGRSAMRAILQEREANGPFVSIHDFCERVDLRSVNRATIEAMIKCGAFDSVYRRAERAALVAAIEDAMKAGQAAASDRRTGQSTFFDSFEDAAPEASTDRSVALPRVEPWSNMESLQHEKDVLGFHASGHPLDQYENDVQALCTHTVKAAVNLDEQAPVVMAGIITRVRTTFARSGQNKGAKMAWVGFQDKTGSIEAVAFSETFHKHAHMLTTDAIVVLLGTIDRRRSEPTIVIERLIPIEAASQHLATGVEIDWSPRTPSDDELERALGELKTALQGSISIGGEGAAPTSSAEVLLNVYVESKCITIQPKLMRVIVDPPLLTRLKTTFGSDCVRLRGGPASHFVRGRNGNGNGHRKWSSTSVGATNGGADSCDSIDRY